MKGFRHKQSAHARVDSERQKNCPSPCSARGSDLGSLDLNSGDLTNDLRPRAVKWGSRRRQLVGIRVDLFVCFIA